MHVWSPKHTTTHSYVHAHVCAHIYTESRGMSLEETESNSQLDLRILGPGSAICWWCDPNSLEWSSKPLMVHCYVWELSSFHRSPLHVASVIARASKEGPWHVPHASVMLYMMRTSTPWDAFQAWTSVHPLPHTHFYSTPSQGSPSLSWSLFWSCFYPFLCGHITALNPLLAVVIFSNYLCTSFSH